MTARSTDSLGAGPLSVPPEYRIGNASGLPVAGHAPDPGSASSTGRERMGYDRWQMADRLGLTLIGYQALEAGDELPIDYELYVRITDLCGWPR